MNRRFFGFLALTALTLPTLPALADDAANEALARRFYTEFNAQNFDALDEFIAADVVDHMATPDMGSGLEAMKKEMQGFASAFSDIQIVNDMVLVSGDYVTVVFQPAKARTPARSWICPPATSRWSSRRSTSGWSATASSPRFGMSSS